jgi:hypothetical protein
MRRSAASSRLTEVAAKSKENPPAVAGGFIYLCISD